MDIDIDFPTSFDPRQYMRQAVPASMVKDDKLQKHPCGFYLQSIPVDPITNLSAIPFEEAEALGYFKIDFLHLSVLDEIGSKEEIRKLVSQDPDWELMRDPAVVERLFHLSKHYQLLQRLNPQSVQDVADALALIRPGKRKLLEEYLRNKEAVRPKLYTKDEERGYFFKRSHAISYALTIILQLHMIKRSMHK